MNLVGSTQVVSAVFTRVFTQCAVFTAQNHVLKGRRELVMESDSGSQTEARGQIGRTIGIRHRVKKTAKGESRPTQVSVTQGGETTIYNLGDDNAELDFVLSRFPTKWRDTTPDDDLAKIPPHHVRWKKIKDDDKRENYPAHLVRKVGKAREVADKIPSAWDGMRQGDTFVIGLGGSGDRFAFALANRGQQMNTFVRRIPPFILKEKRGERDKNDDATLLTEIFIAEPCLFYLVRPRDKKLIRVR